MLVSCLASYSTLKMEVAYSSETSVNLQRTTRRYIQKIEKKTLRGFGPLANYADRATAAF
jgi:hypothetical protein